MSDFGFVYVLTNEYMPDLVKIGCTERSPAARADELSKPSGVPAPFVVRCYIEVREFQAVEKALHKWLNALRINPSREFFEDALLDAVRWMFWHPQRVSFTDCTIPFDEPIEVALGVSSLYQLDNPWHPQAEASTQAQAPVSGSMVAPSDCPWSCASTEGSDA
ncbi:MAG: GIY-YIG nuclease family protein [Actinomycetota bacterium]